jgi:putative aldouronate transport system substrate-binding protein
MDRVATSGLNRRRFIQLAGGVLTAANLLEEACAPSRLAAVAPTPAAAGGSGVGATKLPRYVPFQNGPAPDLPGSITGLEPAYFKFPSRLVKSVAETPGDGSEVSAVTFVPFATPPGMEQNVAWQAVTRQLGVTFRMILASAADYQAKVNTLLSGADLPDFIWNAPFGPFGVIANLPEFVQTRCSDLTQYLSGNAINDYPNLANYSTYSWQAGVVQGGIYGVPVSRGPFANVFQYRQDLFAAAGLSETPRSADDLKRILVTLTRPADNQWGIATSPPAFGLFTASPMLSLFRAPNNWRRGLRPRNRALELRTPRRSHTQAQDDQEASLRQGALRFAAQRVLLAN